MTKKKIDTTSERAKRIHTAVNLIEAHPKWGRDRVNTELKARYGVGLRKIFVSDLKREVLGFPKKGELLSEVELRPPPEGYTSRVPHPTVGDTTNWRFYISGKSKVMNRLFRIYEKWYGCQLLTASLSHMAADDMSGFLHNLKAKGLRSHVYRFQVTLVINVKTRQEAMKAYRQGTSTVRTFHCNWNRDMTLIDDGTEELRSILLVLSEKTEYQSFLVVNQVTVYNIEAE